MIEHVLENVRTNKEANMESGLPIYYYIDDELVDQLWTMLKREAVPTDQIREASAKAAAKAKFGFGNLLSWLAADVSGEISADGEVKDTKHFRYTSLLKTILIKELLPSATKTIDDLTSIANTALPLDSFVEIACSNVEIASLPTSASFVRQLGLHYIGKSIEDRSEMPNEEQALAYLEKMTVSDRAFDVVMKITDEHDNSIIKRLWEYSDNIIYNALSMSNNDHVMIMGKLQSSENDILYSIIKENGIRRTVGAYTGSRKISVFGQLASRDTLPDGGICLGIAPVAITLK